MNTPGKPVRKSTGVSVGKLGTPVPGPSKNNYKRKAAQPFGRVDKTAYVRRSVGVTTSDIPTHDPDNGNNKSQRFNNPAKKWQGPYNTQQPFGNRTGKGGQNMSRLKKGVD